MILSLLAAAFLLSPMAAPTQQGAVRDGGTSASILEVLPNVDHKEYLNDYFVVWSDQPGVLNARLPGSENSSTNRNETYNPSTRRWEGIPYITKTEGGRLWCSIITGGFLEPDNLNYAVMHYSDDDGKTWSNEFLIIDRMEPTAYTYAPILHYEAGKLYIYISGGKVVYSSNPDCEHPSTELNLTKAMFNTGCAFCHAPIKIEAKGDHPAYYLSTCEHGGDPGNIRVVASRDLMTWEDIATIPTSAPAVKKWNEGSIAKLSDGRLMMLGRIDGGTGVERAYSPDGGYTWGGMQTDLPSPYVGPWSKLALVNLPSGGLLMVNHNSTSARVKLTCFLSYDDGKTWPYQLEIDEREEMNTFWGVSYPDVFVDKDGSFYIIWDQRDVSQEIVMCKLREADIKAGQVVSEDCYAFQKVLRTGPCYDITKVEEEFPHLMNVELGTPKADIIARLPATVTYENENGQRVENAAGEWKTEDYNGNQAGIYYFRFALDNKPSKQLDSYRLLKVRVNVIDPNAPVPGDPGESSETPVTPTPGKSEDGGKKGCGGSIAGVAVAGVAALGIVGLAAAKKRKKDE